MEGSVIMERQDANVQAYNSPVTARLLLGGTVDPPQWAMPLIKTLEACTGMPGNREWIQDEISRTPGGTYAFGGVASPGSITSKSPSFLRKKSKPEAAPFPPPSWGSQNNSVGSYFTDSAPQSHSRNMTWDGGNRSKPLERGIDSPSSSRADDFNPFDNLHSVSSVSPSIGMSPEPYHRRAASLSYKTSIAQDRASSPLTKAPNSTTPFLKPREELTRPLLPHEGVARAIALYDFHAAEVRYLLIFKTMF